MKVDFPAAITATHDAPACRFRLCQCNAQHPQLPCSPGLQPPSGAGPQRHAALTFPGVRRQGFVYEVASDRLAAQFRALFADLASKIAEGGQALGLPAMTAGRADKADRQMDFDHPETLDFRDIEVLLLT